MINFIDQTIIKQQLAIARWKKITIMLLSLELAIIAYVQISQLISLGKEKRAYNKLASLITDQSNVQQKKDSLISQAQALEKKLKQIHDFSNQSQLWLNQAKALAQIQEPENYLAECTWSQQGTCIKIKCPSIDHAHRCASNLAKSNYLNTLKFSSIVYEKKLCCVTLKT